MKSIVLHLKSGEVQRISNLPSDAKIVLSVAGDGAGLCLRIYNGSRDTGNQLAIIKDVVSFYDTSLKIESVGKKDDWINQFQMDVEQELLANGTIVK